VPEKVDLAKVDLEWNDDHVLPPVLSLETQFVFQRMTDETLRAVQSIDGHQVLDVGCGRGIDAVSMAKKGGTLFGCEPSRVMLQKAKDWVRDAGEMVRLVRSLAEDLPFLNDSFSRVVCKGAIDHFSNADRAVAEMCRVTSPGGKVVISLANFASLSCLLSRSLNRLSQRFLGREISCPHIWEVPADHTFRFHYANTLALVRRYLQVECVQGVSLLWGLPHWSNVLQKIPRSLALILLRFLDKIASWNPTWSDVLIISGTPVRNLSGKGVKNG